MDMQKLVEKTKSMSIDTHNLDFDILCDLW
jgi:hypothetical protein